MMSEAIPHFVRGGDPKSVLQIGEISQIKEWFATWAPRVSYEIDQDLNVKVKGDLSLIGMPIKALIGTQVKHLPEKLSVGGNIDLKDTPITHLPAGLFVGSFLDLYNSSITQLPDGLIVCKWLDLRHTLITCLPRGLSVGGNLYIKGTLIKSFPKDLRVLGEIEK